MSTVSSISPRAIALTSERPRGYSSAEEINNRAAVSTATDSPHERKALERLDKVMNNINAPRRDVPRGFYLDIRV